ERQDQVNDEERDQERLKDGLELFQQIENEHEEQQAERDELYAAENGPRRDDGEQLRRRLGHRPGYRSRLGGFVPEGTPWRLTSRCLAGGPRSGTEAPASRVCPPAPPACPAAPGRP